MAVQLVIRYLDYYFGLALVNFANNGVFILIYRRFSVLWVKDLRFVLKIFLLFPSSI